MPPVTQPPWLHTWLVLEQLTRFVIGRQMEAGASEERDAHLLELISVRGRLERAGWLTGGNGAKKLPERPKTGRGEAMFVVTAWKNGAHEGGLPDFVLRPLGEGAFRVQPTV